MTISLKHAFQSQKSDGSDTTIVQPSNWNSEHTITCSTGVVLGRASSGVGSVEEIPCTSVGRSLLAASSTADIVSQLNLDTQIQSAFPPGMIAPFAMSSPPSGWLTCDGSAVSRSTYAALFAVIGTTWGSGDGSTTFEVPDLRGVFLRGLDAGKGYDSSRSFASYQADDYPAHTHPVTDPGHSHTYTAGGAATGTVGSSGFPMAVSVSAPSTATSSSATTSITVGSGGGGATEVRPKNVAILYCIRT